MEEKLWKFIDDSGAFESSAANKIKTLYFPLANETIMSSITPDLHGDIKTSHDSFLLTPSSRIDLVNLRSTRNFWIYTGKDRVWSITGVSKNLEQIKNDRFLLRAGLLWHEVTRENRGIGLKAKTLSFVPMTGEPIELMQVTITNITSGTIKYIPTAAIPMYAKGADNIRDHRHVTSLLHRITLHKFGVVTKPTLAFDESGHRLNKAIYFVLGWDDKFSPPQYLYPTEEMFCGDEGDLEAPASVLNNIPSKGEDIEGEEPMGALRFREHALAPGRSRSYIIVMGIVEKRPELDGIINRYKSVEKVKDALEKAQAFWAGISKSVEISTNNRDFDSWFRWVSIQPTLRRIFGSSFLPDFDYGKGGRGWRDLWQDCLGLMLVDPDRTRRLLINNFSGVRIDGSNATIIGKREGEFISDRNNVSRVWMDHGVWPLLTLDLYMNETGDYKILFEEAPYFRNHELNRAQAIDTSWNIYYGQRLKTSSGKVYKGTILEHLLVENLVQFFNVGSHNHVRLEGADWNDGLDMAREDGESVAFSSMYAHNLLRLADIILKIDVRKVSVAEEIKMLLEKVNYNSVSAKRTILEDYFEMTMLSVSGKKVEMGPLSLAKDLKAKSEWMMEHIREREWLNEGFFNGYYDNKKRRVEGKASVVRMMLSSQVFPILGGVAEPHQIKDILKSVDTHLFDKGLGGFHLNTNFKEEQHDLGRAFSFIYGDKENGAFFNHMVIMYAYALYKRGYVNDGWKALSSIYNMAIDTSRSKIYPCLPEYFNLEGRGMYSYLTGSASWFVLTMLTQAFGLSGSGGDLAIEPKLVAEQFSHSRTIGISRCFAGRTLKVEYSNPKRLSWPNYRIAKITLNSKNMPLIGSSGVGIIKRSKIISLPKNKVNTLKILLLTIN